MFVKGFTFYLRGKDVFFVTPRKNKTETLARAIIKALINAGYDIPDAPSVIHDVLWHCRKATLEEKTVKGNTWYKINGSNFNVISPANDTVIITEK